MLTKNDAPRPAPAVVEPPPTVLTLFDIVTEDEGPDAAAPQDPNGLGTRGKAMWKAALKLLSDIETGTKLSRRELRAAMTAAFGSGAASGLWTWKEASDAAEAAVNLLLLRYGRHLLTSTDAFEFHRKLTAIAALEPPTAGRDDEQVRLQAFSTPLAMAHAVLRGAQLRPNDRVLEPSAGTGTLAVLAAISIDRSKGGALHANEISARRRALLSKLLPPHAVVTAENAEHISEHTVVEPTVVLMNPPFSRRTTRRSVDSDADLIHVRAAYRALAPGGRLVTVTSEGCIPQNEAWRNAFRKVGAPEPIVRYSAPITGREYRSRGTEFETRLTVIDRPGGSGGTPADADPVLLDEPRTAAELLEDMLTIGVVPERADPEIRTPETARHPQVGQPAERRSKKTARRAPGSKTGDSRAGEARDLDMWGPPVEIGVAGRIQPALEPERTADEKVDNTPFITWRPGFTVNPDAPEHPTKLVESASMGSVSHIDPDQKIMLPERARTTRALSAAQVESVLLCASSHARELEGLYRANRSWDRIRRVDAETEAFWADAPGNDAEKGRLTLRWLEASGKNGLTATDTGDAESKWSTPTRVRRGWMLGDGTGAGKGRQVAAVIADRWLRRSTRAVWVSQSQTLIEDSRRDWAAIGGNPADIFPAQLTRANEPIPKTRGILFITYASLRVGATEERRARVDQVVEWLAGSLKEDDRQLAEPVIVFDEAHAMVNAAGSKTGARGGRAPSLQGLVSMKLQNALPKARVMYVSATGAAKVDGLCYASRLGLWATDATPFEKREDFIAAMDDGGIAALELMARDMKSMGLYQCRALAYDGVEIDMLVHEVTEAQKRLWDQWANAFRIIHEQLEVALEETGITNEDGNTLNKQVKSAALSRFEGLKQRFFNHMLCSLKTRTLINRIDTEIAAGHAVIVQLVSTGEALTNRRLAEIPVSDWNDVRIDLTPREYVLEYLERAFPTQMYEEYEDEDGKSQSRPVYDSEGKPVVCRNAQKRRENLMQQLLTATALPGALDVLVQHYGAERVAEISGRSRRIVRETDEEGLERYRIEVRSASANLVETAAFQEGDKDILVFSRAGNTGRSYHDEIGAPVGSRRRYHFLLEAGWEATQAIQGLGRSHRTHQATAPVFCPTTTDIKGERRFNSTIAARLAALGAITRGQRDSQSAMDSHGGSLFREEDNFDSEYAKTALLSFLRDVAADRIDGWTEDEFAAATGLRLRTAEGDLKSDMPPMSQVLNRLLALPIDDQNTLFAELEARIAENISAAKEAGTYDVGVEELRVSSIKVSSRTGIPNTAAELVEFEAIVPVTVVPADKALQEFERLQKSQRRPELVVNGTSGRSAIASEWMTFAGNDGAPDKNVRLFRPSRNETMNLNAFHHSEWDHAEPDEWRQRWEKEADETGRGRPETVRLAVGTLLPIWHKLPKMATRVYRTVTDDGVRFIGRVIHDRDLAGFHMATGLETTAEAASKVYTFDHVLKHGGSIPLSNGWKLGRRRVMDEMRVEVFGADYGDLDTLRRLGCNVERIHYSMHVTVLNARTYARIVSRHPITLKAAAATESDAAGA